MTRYSPLARPTATPVTHYVEATATGELIGYTPAQLAARQRRDAILYARRMHQRAAIAERDRRRRTVLLGLGATLGVGLLAGIGVAGWLLYTALAAINWWLVAGLAVIALVALGVLGRAGRGCTTVVQHWH
jgi:hypothetical protein